MYQDNKPKAVIVKTFTHSHVELRLTEKGAVNCYIKDTNGVANYRFTVMPKDVEIHALLGSTAFQDILNSPEWEATKLNKEQNKAKSYAIKQLGKAITRREQEVQAAMDKLAILGVDVNTLLKPKAS